MCKGWNPTEGARVQLLRARIWRAGQRANMLWMSPERRFHAAKPPTSGTALPTHAGGRATLQSGPGDAKARAPTRARGGWDCVGFRSEGTPSRPARWRGHPARHQEILRHLGGRRRCARPRGAMAAPGAEVVGSPVPRRHRAHRLGRGSLSAAYEHERWSWTASRRGRPRRAHRPSGAAIVQVSPGLFSRGPP